MTENESRKEIMTRSHPRWNEFIEILSGEGYCNFRRDEEKGYIWNCSQNKVFTKEILEKNFPEIDVYASLEQFGDYCDCEIVFNLA